MAENSAIASMGSPSELLLDDILQTVTTVSDFPDLYRRHVPDRIAVEHAGTKVTYKELADRSDFVARFLVSSGIRVGDRIAVMCKNNLGFYYLLFAASRVGAVLVALNARLTASEISFMLADSESVLLFADADCAAVATEAMIGNQRIGRYVQIGSDGSLAEIDRAQETPLPAYQDPRVECLQMYTSGTTGRPKGVILTHANLLSMGKGGCSGLGPFTSDTVHLICLPMFHIAGIDWLMFALMSCSPIVLMKEVVPPLVLQIMNAKAVSAVLLVPTVIRMVVEEAERAEIQVPSLRTLVFGASPMPTELIGRAKSIFPNARLFHVYGLTETAGMFTSMPVSEDRLESCGKPWEGSAIRINGPDGAPLPPNSIGHVVCKSPQLMPGYWRRPEDNDLVFKEEWFQTGDAGYIDQNGFLFIKDRIKDMVKTGGENVFPAEVEEVLSRHPAIAEVAVIGIPDPKWDEIVVAIVRLNEGCRLDERDCDVFVREKLGGFKAPKRYEVVEEFPRNASSKILKTVLRERYS